MSKASLVSALTRRLEGKVALITGGASGIGAYTAKLFTKHGAKVAIADINSPHHDDDPSNPITYIHCDVTNEQHVKNAVDKTVSAYGKLDVMFNNAGICDPPKPRIIDNTKSDFERVLDINVMGVFLGMKHAARVMIPRRSGTIISSASIASGLGGSAPHAYTCSKHAVVGLTKNVAAELGRFGIRVNCLSPYTVATPMATKVVEMSDEELESMTNSLANLKGVTLKVEDVGNAALFLASDEAKYVSGVNLFVDGGMSIVNPAFGLFDNAESSYD